MRQFLPSLPGLTPQVGFTRLAALVGTDLGQARGPMQSIIFKSTLFAKKMDARVKPGHDDLCEALILATMGSSPRMTSRAQRPLALLRRHAGLLDDGKV